MQQTLLLLKIGTHWSRKLNGKRVELADNEINEAARSTALFENPTIFSLAVGVNFLFSSDWFEKPFFSGGTKNKGKFFIECGEVKFLQVFRPCCSFAPRDVTETLCYR